LVAVLAGASAWFLTGGLRYEELSEVNAYVARAVQSQRWVLANQILIRKAAKQMEEARSVEGSWQFLISALAALDFDGITCQLPQWRIGQAPSLAGWSRDGEQSSSESWNVSIPLRAGEKVVGELQLWRALRKERLLFQFSSLLDTLIPSFEKQLKTRYDAQEMEPEQPSVLPGPALQPRILAPERKG
jgi:hypothetical protein